MSEFDQINTADNSKETVTNEKHLPVITIEDLGDKKHKVKVFPGGGKHPNERDHWFQWVELQVNGLYVGRAEFSAVITDPVAEFVLNCGKTCQIGALARCNRHGLWYAEVTCSC